MINEAILTIFVLVQAPTADRDVQIKVLDKFENPISCEYFKLEKIGTEEFAELKKDPKTGLFYSTLEDKLFTLKPGDKLAGKLVCDGNDRRLAMGTYDLTTEVVELKTVQYPELAQSYFPERYTTTYSVTSNHCCEPSTYYNPQLYYSPCCQPVFRDPCQPCCDPCNQCMPVNYYAAVTPQPIRQVEQPMFFGQLDTGTLIR